MSDAQRFVHVPLPQRLLPALRLDHAFYTGIANDPTSRGQAFLVVVLGGVLHGIALRGRLGALAIWGGVLGALGGWLSMIVVVELVAAVCGFRREGRSLARPLGFATAPMFLMGLAVIPQLALLVSLTATLWVILTSAAAIGGAYQTSWRSSALLSLLVFGVYMVFGVLLDLLLSSPG